MSYNLQTVPTELTPSASALLSQLERKRTAAALAVPTNDVRVRAHLRKLGEPITLFGEDASDRRGRLRELLLVASENPNTAMELDVSDSEGGSDAAEDEEGGEFYSEGSDAMVEARKVIARFSLPRAKERIELQKREAGIQLRTHIKHRKAVKDRLAMFELAGSQIAAERPVSVVRFAPNGQTVAAGNWGGGIKVLSVPDLGDVRTLRGHTGLVGGISWMPGAGLEGSGVSREGVNIASGGGEGNVHLWSLQEDTPLATLEGHSGRVCRVEFHPSGRYLASASYDTTWRLWDVEAGTELLLQEGHSREVYTVSFNTDGSLLASAGLDSIGRVWDLRTGRTVMIMDGHIREVYALDWGVDGHRILSGSGDGWVKCWDVRMVRAVGGVGAHRSTVSDIRWYKGLDGPGTGAVPEKDEKGDARPKKAGTFFVSSGYDKNVNIYSADDWSLAKTLSGHSGNVMSVDVTKDARWIVSSGQDRTVKLWGCDDGAGI